jgi:NAD(P)-dependent dehydrogenase (short-subunit alcohol dehydrogenase family)
MEKKVWLITGCSTGFGRELATMALQMGYNVAVTARKTNDIVDITKDYASQSLTLSLDVTKPDEITDAVQQTMARFGRIDVLVNNAGIGYFGAIEESEEAMVRQMFEINFWGLTKMIQEVLPIMRQQRSGHILNVASIGGLVGFPAVGFYNATKFAVDGLSESLAKEVAHLGIKVTIIAPSGFRTDWAGRSAANSHHIIADYAETAGQNKSNIRGNSGRQAGDPVRAAAAIIKAVEATEPPLRLLLGNGAVNGAKLKLETLKKDYDNWEEVSRGADFPQN